MWRRLRTLVVAVGVVTAGCWLAPTAAADPNDNPCPLSMALMCHFLPIAPGGLDGGDDGVIDLTTNQPTVDPQAPAELPPMDPCQRGCI
jgi:hypothetical protein